MVLLTAIALWLGSVAAPAASTGDQSNAPPSSSEPDGCPYRHIQGVALNFSTLSAIAGVNQASAANYADKISVTIPASGNTEGKPIFAYHTLAICVMSECSGVELLNFQYGSSDIPALRADKDYLVTGHIPQGTWVTGMFPIGKFLYVKWKDVSTKIEYEKTADLESQLPVDLNHKIIHASMEGSQLHIEVIEGNDKAALHDLRYPDCPAKMYGMFKCTAIYPDRWANF